MLDTKNEQTLINIIKNEFPEISWKIYELFDNGWDNQVILLDNKIVFRFPRNEEAKITQQKERYLLDFVKGRVDIVIPQYTFFTPDNTCVGYPAISGMPMTVEMYNKLSEDIQQAIQQQLATFLTQLHSIPLLELEKIGYIHQRGTTNEWSQNFQKNFIQTCGKYFTEKEIQIVCAYIQELQELDFEYKVLTHSDLQQKNIFIDNDLSHITGIIDFSDARIADPALDFDTLLDYGDEFVDGVYKLYRGQKDDNLLQRAKFYKKRGYIYVFIHAVENEENIEEKLSKFRSIFF